MLILLDHYSQIFNPFHNILYSATQPFYSIVNISANFSSWIGNKFTSNDELREEIKRLRLSNQLLQAKNQKLIALSSENMRLRSLLHAPRKQEELQVAETLQVDLDPFKHLIVINKGAKHHIYKGQPIIDAYGIMGQITQVNHNSSIAILITDPAHAIPVQVNRNGLRAIAFGTGSASELELLYLPNNAEIEEGDLLETSGLGGHFPTGYPVAVVSSVKRNPKQAFATIKAQPIAHLKRSREVLFISIIDNEQTHTTEQHDDTE